MIKSPLEINNNTLDERHNHLNTNDYQQLEKLVSKLMQENNKLKRNQMDHENQIKAQL